jgi:hypothetical protein
LAGFAVSAFAFPLEERFSGLGWGWGITNMAGFAASDPVVTSLAGFAGGRRLSLTLGLGFLLRSGSRILRVVVAKKPDCCLAFWLKGVEQRRAGARRQGCSGTWFRTTLCFTLRKYSQANQMSPSMVALCERCRRTCAFQKFSERDG